MNLVRKGQQLADSKAQEMASLRRAQHPPEKVRRPAAVRLHAFGLSLQCLHASRGQLDERLQEIRKDALAPARQPQALPGDVAFPIEAAVEEVDAVQVGAAVWPLLRF